MDVWIEFKCASKWQAEHVFANFFPSAVDIPPAGPPPSLEDEKKAAGISVETIAEAAPSPTPSSSSSALAPSTAPLDNAKLIELAKQFAEAIPDDEFSVAALQGCKFLLYHQLVLHLSFITCAD